MGKEGLTGSKYLCEDAFLVGAVNVVWCFSSFVGAVEQAAIFRVPQQQLSQLSAAPSDGNVERRVSFLKGQKIHWQISIRKLWKKHFKKWAKKEPPGY